MNKGKNILALDIGDQKIGAAISSGIYVSEYRVIPFSSEDDFLSRLEKIRDEENIGEIVVGLPLLKDGSKNQKMYVFAKDISQKIKQRFKIKVCMEDERFTSYEAARQLKEEGVKEDEIKKRKDARAAKIILEQYLAK